KHGGMPERSLKEALARLIQPLANQPVSAADFDDERVPGHLRMNFRAVDERGRIAGSDRDLAALQQRLSDRSRQSVSRSIGKSTGASLGSATPSMPAALRGSLSPSTGLSQSKNPTVVERDDLTDWTFGDLPEVLDRKVAGGVVRGYPAIIDRGKSASVRLGATADAAPAARLGEH